MLADLTISRSNHQHRSEKRHPKTEAEVLIAPQAFFVGL